MKEKYGFVYIWYDKKHKRYYIGCRWGNENDGYICSSPWMKRGYKKRSNDFKRKILAKVYTNKKDLLEEEYKWLSLIKNDELGKKYYNLHNHHFGHWSTDENKRLTVGQKISASPNRRQNISKAQKGKTRHSEEDRIRISTTTKKQFSDPQMRELFSEKSKELWQDPEYRKKQEEIRSRPGYYKGFTGKHTEEAKRLMSEKRKGKSTSLKGKTLPHLHGSHWYNNGIINIKRKECPEGFVLGKMKRKK